MSLLDALTRGRHLRTLDTALASTLQRLDPATPDLVAAGAALASLAVAHGHAGFDLSRPEQLIDAGPEWPAPDTWLAALSSSAWVVTSTSDATAGHRPLVLEGGLLYLRRYREYERRLVGRLRALATTVPAPVDAAVLAPVFAALFPPGASDPLQARAAALALHRALLLVTGGPGTGKTTTIARLLVLLVAQAHLAGGAPPRIALAAPTGRAAERMAESLHAAIARLKSVAGFDPAWCEALPTGASTLHRLLGTMPGSPRFRHDADHPLPFDVVVVDEASMVDLPLMCKLAEAVPDGARLVLLGDPDQLPSVEAGDVLASICEAAGQDAPLPVALAAWLGEDAAPPLAAAAIAAGEPPPVGQTPDLFAPTPAPDRSAPASRGSFLHGHRVHLRRGFRQSADFELAPLAEAVREGNTELALQLLRGGTLRGVHFHEDATDPLASGASTLLPHWRALADGNDPATALAAAARLRLLTPVRAGPQGARMLNARIEEALAGARPPVHFHGRLLLVTENSYRHQLFNGDIGVCLRDPHGTLVAWFPGAGGDVRSFHPAALPAHESAFAMTVHKAQGSEFDAVWLQLPRSDGRGLSRELLYTALTRARRQLHLCASEAVLRGALGRHAARVSGLGERLRGHGSTDRR